MRQVHSWLNRFRRLFKRWEKKAEKPVYGLRLIEELSHYDYEVRRGTYPTLHSLEKDGLLKSYKEVVEGKVHKCKKKINVAQCKIENTEIH